MWAVFFCLVTAVLTCGGAGGGGSAAAPAVEEIGVIDVAQGFLQVRGRVLQLLVLPELHAASAAAACVVQRVLIAADALLREAGRGREERDHSDADADCVGGVEGVRVEVDRGGGLRVVMVLEGGRGDEVELRRQAAVDVAGSGGGGGGGPHSPGCRGPTVVGGGGGGAGIESQREIAGGGGSHPLSEGAAGIGR